MFLKPFYIPSKNCRLPNCFLCILSDRTTQHMGKKLMMQSFKYFIGQEGFRKKKKLALFVKDFPHGN